MRWTAAVIVLLLGVACLGAAEVPVIFGGWAEPADDLPHLESPHEWWYFAVQASSEEPCGRWQAMVSLVRDAEALADHLLFTTVVDGVAANRSGEHVPGSMTYAVTGDLPPSRYTVNLGTGSIDVGRFDGVRRVHAVSGNATLDLTLVATTDTLWRRRAPEGAGALEIILAPRATVTGSLTLGTTVCPIDGLGYFEHVWGTWSRVPMWGVDFLSAHAGGWSVVARRTPMRGETRGYPTGALAEPVMVVTDGTQIFEAAETTFAMTEAGSHPDLGVGVPVGYSVTGAGFGSPGPSSVTLEVGAPAFASILLPLSSGILEGWAPATVTVDGATHGGTSEAELQRYGTSYPH